jgi:hypothetical protein
MAETTAKVPVNTQKAMFPARHPSWESGESIQLV